MMNSLRAWTAGLLMMAAVAVSAGTTRAAAADGNMLRSDVETLASKSFEGRGVGTAGLDRARDYLERRFADIGLRPLGVNDYRQPFNGPNGTTLVNLIGVLGEADGDRHIIVGAHYDHLGMGEPGDANAGKLHPGADDNASGVAALLECARRVAGEEDLRGSVVFIAFSGEEKGLMGSAYYVEHPSVPLAGCEGMINLDTVGRLFDGALTVFGANTAMGMSHVLEGINYGFKFTLEMPEKDVGGSDQTSFVRRGVPALQIFTGANADYHRPGDTADKIDYDGLERVAGFATELALYLADRDEPITFVPPGADKAAGATPPAGGSGRKVSFGSIPDFNYTGEGVRVSGVIPDSPAAKAGLKEGDVLVEFAGVAVDDLRSFSDILKGLNPGDTADVVYVRDGERRTTTVTVVERK